MPVMLRRSLMVKESADTATIPDVIEICFFLGGYTHTKFFYWLAMILF